MSLEAAIADAVEYFDSHEIEVPRDIRIRARRVGAIKAGGDLSSINAQYHDAITAALTTFFEGGSVASPKNAFKRAATDALGAAFDFGWVAGGQDMPPDEDALSWFNARLDQEFGFIETVFASAKQLRKEEGFERFAWVGQRADAYTRTAGALYNAGMMFAQKNKMLTWRLGNTEKHCDTCLKLDGNSHRASWYLARNYIPRQAGAGMDCGGYNCDCTLEDKQGKEVTI